MPLPYHQRELAAREHHQGRPFSFANAGGDGARGNGALCTGGVRQGIPPTDRWHPADGGGARSEAIAIRRKEMMEMLRDVAETDYELSLRDMVEVPGSTAARAEEEEEKNSKAGRKPQSALRRETTTALIGGEAFLLNMFLLPVKFGRRKARTAGSRVAPTRCQGKGAVDGERARDVDLSTERGGRAPEPGSRHGSKKMSGCFPFFAGASRSTAGQRTQIVKI